MISYTCTSNGKWIKRINATISDGYMEFLFPEGKKSFMKRLCCNWINFLQINRFGVYWRVGWYAKTREQNVHNFKRSHLNMYLEFAAEMKMRDTLECLFNIWEARLTFVKEYEFNFILFHLTEGEEKSSCTHLLQVFGWER